MKFPSLETLRARGTRKWTQFDDDVLPLWVAESDFPTAEPVKEAIKEAVEKEAFGYSPAFHHLGDAVSDFYADRYGWRPDPAKIFPVADVVRGMLLSVQFFTKPDSPVIVPVPSYPPFLEIPATAGREMVEVGAKDGLDLMEVEAAFRNGAGSILLAAPNNPWGYTFDEEELAQLCSIADKYGARVLADEIHAPIVYSGHKHTCAAGINEQTANVCITVTATSKAWNIAGLKCAQIIFSNDEDVKTWNSLTGVSKDGTGTLGIIASEACYRFGTPALEDQLAALERNRDWLIETLPEAIPGIEFTRPEATYLMFLNFEGTALGDEEPARFLRREAKVALNEGVTFGSGGAHHARLNFATSPDILAEAVDRMSAAIRARH